ncbi:MAG: NAD(P)-dependent oxidoreductase [Oscillospiraceae bacterium]|nr:NAD(P)-dependent oxidoreductase [Oscillospiraceae bacterium]
MALHIVNEANRCLNCKNPMCQKGCPVHTPIPTVIQLFKENRLMEAGTMLFENNPLSAVCAIVCNHEKQCAGNCIRGRKDTPVHFSSIEAYVSDMYLDRMIVDRAPVKKDKKAAVIGCGPAGMVVAMKLAQQGYPVTVFEWKGKIGGMLQYGIPDYRLPKSFLDRYQTRMEEMGITIRTNTTIGAVLMIDNLFRDGYKAVFIGTGAEKPRALDMEGESLGNVHYGLNYLANPKGHKLGDTVAVIGMGNAAVDVARTALRNGSRHVTLYARSKNVTASSSELAYAELDGAEFVFGMQIERISEEGPVFKKAIFDENDNIVGYEPEPVQVHADSTVISISQVPRRKLVRTTDGLEAGEGGRLIVDENFMTTRPGVFAAGDNITGAKTVVHAVDGAKKAAEAMIRYMEEPQH